jgi:hypothetical protein
VKAKRELPGRLLDRLDKLTAGVGDGKLRIPPHLRELRDVYNVPGSIPQELRGAESARAAAESPPKGAYESRVMQGIWAAAPYLHNGSVPTLADLLKPAAQRPASFKIGPAYDREKIGLAVDQPTSNFTLQTADCSDLNSGNSRCGHEFGATLSDDDKRALLEYLKTL